MQIQQEDSFSKKASEIIQQFEYVSTGLKPSPSVTKITIVTLEKKNLAEVA